MTEWIKLKDQKPPIGVPLIVTIFDGIRHRKELRFPVYYHKSAFSENMIFCLWGDEERMLTKEYSQVLAWSEFPEICDCEVE